MSRLTKDLKTPHDDTAYSDVVVNAVDRENIVLTKLKHYENLEDDLGCPLEVVFKALKEGSIEDEDGGLQIVGITIGGDGELYLHAINGDLYLLKAYGKTWWLKSDRSDIDDK